MALYLQNRPNALFNQKINSTFDASKIFNERGIATEYQNMSLV